VGRTMHIAVVVDRLHEYQMPVIRGVESVVHGAGGAVLILLSHPLHADRDTTLRWLVQAGLLQGVVVTAMRDVVTHRDRVREVAGLADGVPVVTVGVQLAGYPAVLSENAGGVRAALSHLLDDCGRQSPIMIAGILDNDDSRERENAFLGITAERGLTLPPSPVVHAHFEREHAYRAIIQRMDRGRDFDAVLVANDDMAKGVLDALNDREVKVPGEVAVIGFDNNAESYLTNPPLSSVDNGLEEQGRSAARIVLARIAGQEVPTEVRPPAALVVRHSSAAGTLPQISESDRAHLRELRSGGPAGEEGRPAIAHALTHVIVARTTVAGAQATAFDQALQRLLTTWLPEVVDGTLGDSRAAALGHDLVDVVTSRPEPLWWRSLVGTIQAVLTETSPDDRLAAQIRASVLQFKLEVNRALSSVREKRDREVLALSENVLELNRGMSRSRSLDELVREIGAYLPRLNVSRCFLAVLEQPIDLPAGPPVTSAPVSGPKPSLMARLAFTYVNGESSSRRGSSPYNILGLLPASHAINLQHGTLTLQSLFSADRWYGFLLHEQTVTDRHTGEALRAESSRVLDALTRAEELIERAKVLEEMVSTRTQQLEHEVANRRNAEESLREANVQLRLALLMDGLTGLHNRPSFDEHLNQAWIQHKRNHEPLSLLMIDVDHFKRYNDTYGHLAGDACLRQVAQCLQAAVPRKQDIAARYGGEEFAIILRRTDAQGARIVAERVLENLRAEALPHAASDEQWVSASIGIGCSQSEAASSSETLLDLADRALYTAKRNGRNRVEELDL
jgi:diguanylate cyclase (GGDEF)-like protein